MKKEVCKYPEHWDEVYKKWREGCLSGPEAIQLLKVSKSTFYEKVRSYEKENQIKRTKEEKAAAAEKIRLRKKKNSYPDNWEEVYHSWRKGFLKSKGAIELLKISDSTFYEKVKKYETDHGLVRKSKGRKPNQYPVQWKNIYEKWQLMELTATEAADILKVPYKSFYNMAKRYEVQEGIQGKRFNHSAKYRGIDRVSLFIGDNAIKIREFNDYLERNVLPRIDYQKLSASYFTEDMSYAKGVLHRLYEAMDTQYHGSLVKAALKQRTAASEGIFVPGVIATEKGEFCLALLTVDKSGQELIRADLLTEHGCRLREAVIEEAAIEEAVIEEAALKKAAIKENAIKEAAIKENTIRKAAIRENMIKEDILKALTIKAAGKKEVQLNSSMEQYKSCEYGYIFLENRLKRIYTTPLLGESALALLTDFQYFRTNLLFEGL